MLCAERVELVSDVVPVDWVWPVPEVTAPWISFKAATYSSSRLARLHRAIHRREWSNLAHALASFQTRSEARNTAIAIKAMVEGFRFRLAAVPPANFDSRIPVLQVLGFLEQRVPDFKPAAKVPKL